MTKQIPLTQGKFATVDDADYEWLNQWKWTAYRNGNNWYAIRFAGQKKNRKGIAMHRLIANAPVGMDVDHKDHDGLNNTKGNLRVCTRAQNLRNRKMSKSNSGYIGVHKEGDGYRATIAVSGKTHYVGYFHSAEEAAKARDEAARKLHGEFARTNF